MKKVSLFLFAIGFYHTLLSQIPESFNYQAIPRSGSGAIYPEQLMNVRISILKDSPAGSSVYTETFNTTTDSYGMINLELGLGTPSLGTFSSIDWTAGLYYLKVEIELSGSTEYRNIGTSQILSIPTDLPSKNSKKASLTVKEDELFISRKYMGKFVDYRQTGPKDYNGPNLIWIKTSMDKNFGKISAYGKKCDFTIGDNLYLKRSFYSPGGVSGYWVYQIENDSSVFYRATEFQHDRKIFIETWF